MSKRNKSGGSGCGWILGTMALIAAVWSLGISGGVAVGDLTGGSVGLPAQSHDLAGLLLVVALVAVGLARTQRR